MFTVHVRVATSQFARLEKFRVKYKLQIKPKFFKFVVCNPCLSSPYLTIHVPFMFFLLPLKCFSIRLVKYYFQVSFHVKIINFEHGQNALTELL